MLWWARIKTRTLSKNVKIDPQDNVYQGTPHNAYKKSKNINIEPGFEEKFKTHTLSKNVKIDPQEYVYKRFPHDAYKNSKTIDNELGYHPHLSTITPKI